MFSLITPDRIWSRHEVGCAVAGAVEGLTRLGVREGSRVGLAWPNRPETLFVLLALYQLRAVACMASTRLPTVALAELWKQVDLVLELQQWPSASAPTMVELTPSDRPVSLLWTSGSTGQPKPVLLSAANHYWSAVGSQANLPLQSDDCWLLNLPLYHTGGLSIVWRCLLSGASIRLGEGAVTHASLVATQLVRLVRDQVAPWAGIRFILVGGGPTPEPLLKEAIGQGWPVHATYGLTEMASQVATSPVPGGAMRLLPHRSLQLDAQGQILVGGKTLSSALGDWYPTRDLGRWRDDGSLEVVGRIDNQFVSGGEKIQPEEIEALLLSFPSVRRALVMPVQDGEFGQRPVAFVEGEVALEALRERLPGYKIPVALLPWPEGEQDLKPSRLKMRQHLPHAFR